MYAHVLDDRIALAERFGTVEEPFFFGVVLEGGDPTSIVFLDAVHRAGKIGAGVDVTPDIGRGREAQVVIRAVDPLVRAEPVRRVVPTFGPARWVCVAGPEGADIVLKGRACRQLEGRIFHWPGFRQRKGGAVLRQYGAVRAVANHTAIFITAYGRVALTGHDTPQGHRGQVHIVARLLNVVLNHALVGFQQVGDGCADAFKLAGYLRGVLLLARGAVDADVQQRQGQQQRAGQRDADDQLCFGMLHRNTFALGRSPTVFVCVG